MSIDNVIAVAAAASRAPGEYRVTLLVIGLATSIPLIIIGSTMLMKVMERFPIIIILGAALLGLLAGRDVRRPTRRSRDWFLANRRRMPELVFGIGGATPGRRRRQMAAPSPAAGAGMRCDRCTIRPN